MSEITDVVIVGAGSAGCVLAARLSEDPKLQVTLVEAGGKDSSPWVHIPAGLLKLLGKPEYDWCFASGPEPHMDSRMVPVPRGKMLGGTSSINGMLYVRGNSRDYDRWADEGCPGWSWNDVLPYFCKSEDQVRGASTFHGVGGPLAVSDIAHDTLSDAFVEACAQVGNPRTNDFNDASNDGAGYYQINTRRGRRASTSQVFLKPSLDRPNLRVITDAHVTGLTFAGRRCTGVTYVAEGRSETIAARAEVILAAGSYLSPAILQRAGIGPGSLLQGYGIEVLADREGVGANLQDHLHTRVGYKTTIPTVNTIAHSPLRQFVEGIRYKLTQKGFLAYGVFRAGLFTNSPYSRGWPDLQILFGLVSYDELIPHKFPGCSINVIQLHPESRGRVRIKGADPMLAPSIISNFLAEEHDRKVLIAAVRMARMIGRQPALKPFLLDEIQPGAADVSDYALLQHIKATGYTVHHPVGTCRMGSDERSVVDLALKVRGVDGLRVVDASVMPTIVSGNTNAPTIMIAEKAADLIKADLKKNANRD